MAGKTAFLSYKILNHVLRGGGAEAYTAPGSVYMALLHDATGANPLVTSTQIDSSYEFGTTEATTTGYAGYQRATITAPTVGGNPGSTVFAAAGTNVAQTAGAIKNSQSIVFRGHTGGDSQGTVKAFALLTSAGSGTAGDVLYYGTVNNKVININNTPPTVAGSALTIEES